MSQFKTLKPTYVSQERGVIGLARENGADSKDIGFVGTYNASGAKYSGFARSNSDKKWYLFDGTLGGNPIGSDTISGLTTATKADVVIKDLTAVTGGFTGDLGVTGNYTSANGNIDLASGYLEAGNLRLSNNTLSTRDTNGNLIIAPNGTGSIYVGSVSTTTEVATHDYVDAIATGLDIKNSVRVATIAPLPAVTTAGLELIADANGVLVIDGVTVALNDRVLIKNQVLGAQNGIYTITQLGDVSTPFILRRSTDTDGTPSSEVTTGMFTFVEQGSQAAQGWILTTASTIIVGTTSLSFSQFNAATVFTAASLGTGAAVYSGVIGNQFQFRGLVTSTGSNASLLSTSASGNDVTINIDTTKITSVGTLTGLSVSGTSGLGDTTITGLFSTDDIHIPTTTNAAFTITDTSTNFMTINSNTNVTTFAGASLNTSASTDITVGKDLAVIGNTTLSGNTSVAANKFIIINDTGGNQFKLGSYYYGAYTDVTGVITNNIGNGLASNKLTGVSADGALLGDVDITSGVTFVNGDRVLLTSQTTGSENGIYVVNFVSGNTNGTWEIERATDFDATNEQIIGKYVKSTGGSYTNSYFTLTAAGILNTNVVTWTNGVAPSLGATGILQDNLASALSIRSTDYKSYMRFDTTNGTEKVFFDQNTQFNSGVNFAGALITDNILIANTTNTAFTISDSSNTYMTINTNTGTSTFSGNYLKTGATTDLRVGRDLVVDGTTTLSGDTGTAKLSVGGLLLSNNINITPAIVGAFTLTDTVDNYIIINTNNKVTILAGDAVTTSSTTDFTAGRDLYITGNTQILGNANVANIDLDNILSVPNLGYIGGLLYKESVRVRSTVNIAGNYSSSIITATINGELIVDGVTTAIGDRILLMNQTDPSHNGIYKVLDTGSVATVYAIGRTTDSDSAADLKLGAYTLVTEGTIWARTIWVVTTAPVTFNTDPIVFSQLKTTTDQITFVGADGANSLLLTDNYANALNIKSTDNKSYIRFVTTNASEHTEFDQTAVFSGGVSVTAPATFTSTVTLQSADPSANYEAAPKIYVDKSIRSQDVKKSVRAVTTTNIVGTRTSNIITADANGAIGTLGGVALVLNDRLLVAGQTSAIDNGIYYVSDAGGVSTPFTLTRDTDADENSDVTSGMFTFVEEGTGSGRGYLLTTANPIVVNTTALTFSHFNAATIYTASNLSNGVGVFSSLVGSDFRYNSLAAGVVETGSLLAVAEASGKITYNLNQTAITKTGTLTAGSINWANNITTSGTIASTDATVTNVPTLATSVVNRDYIDTRGMKDPVICVTISNLSATYAGATPQTSTLTSTVSQDFNDCGALDGFIGFDQNDVDNGARILVWKQSNPIHNGIYTLTTLGDVGTPWVLTRSHDFYAPGHTDPGVIVTSVLGDTYKAAYFDLSSMYAVIGTNNISFVVRRVSTDRLDFIAASGSNAIRLRDNYAAALNIKAVDNTPVLDFVTTTGAVTSKFYGVLQSSGGFQTGVTSINYASTTTGAYTATINICRLNVDATGGNITITIPSQTLRPGIEYSVVKSDASANTVTIAVASGDMINGVVDDTIVLTQRYDHSGVRSHGSVGWYVI